MPAGKASFWRIRFTCYGIVRCLLLTLTAQWIVVLLCLADSMTQNEHSIAFPSPHASPLRDLTSSQRAILGSPISRGPVPPPNPSCISQVCLQGFAQRLARIFPDRTDQQWCLEAAQSKNRQRGGEWQGILLVKVPKVASSTAAGVSLRISRRRNCLALQWRHRQAANYVNRSMGPSFLWTTIRDPAHRALSSLYYHDISRRRSPARQNVTDVELVQLLQTSTHVHSGAVSDGQGGFQLRYVALQEIPPHFFWNASHPEAVRQPQVLVRLVQDTLEAYDFVAVTERMDESLVVLALRLGVDVADVLVTASKVAGRNYQLVHLPHNQFQCIATLSSIPSAAVQEFFESPTWRAANWGDYMLHQAATRSLDRTIAAIGKERFAAAMAEYRHWRALEKYVCGSQVDFPCSNEGLPQPNKSRESCYLPFYDFGCGYPCIDRIIVRGRQSTRVQ